MPSRAQRGEFVVQVAFAVGEEDRGERRTITGRQQAYPIGETREHRIHRGLGRQRVIHAAEMEAIRKALRGQQCGLGFSFAHIRLENHQTGFRHGIGRLHGGALRGAQRRIRNPETFGEQSVVHGAGTVGGCGIGRSFGYIYWCVRCPPWRGYADLLPRPRGAGVGVECGLVLTGGVEREVSCIAGDPVADDHGGGQQGLRTLGNGALRPCWGYGVDSVGGGHPIEQFEPAPLPVGRGGGAGQACQPGAGAVS